MTYREFLAKLRKTPRKWRLTKAGRIRCQSGACPMGYFSKIYKEPFPKVAADLLKMKVSITVKIAEASDNSWGNAEGPTRRDLLKACGLKEKK